MRAKLKTVVLLMGAMLGIAACEPVPVVVGPPPPDPAFTPPGVGWALAGTTERGAMWIHLGPGTRWENIARTWEIINGVQWQVVPPTQARSLQGRVEYDCRRNQIRRIGEITGYTDVNGQGQVMFVSPPSGSLWLAIPPNGTLSEALVLACGRRGTG